MTSPLPPRRRDTRELADRVRQDRNNLKQLGIGFVGGRFPLARPLGSTAQFGDLEDDQADSEVAFVNTDKMTYSGTGPIVLTLSAYPFPGSEHVHWGPLTLSTDSWTRSEDGATIYINCPHAKAGDVFSCYYATDTASPIETLTYVDLVNSFGPLVYPRLVDLTGPTLTDGSVWGRDGVYNFGISFGAAGLLPSLSDPSSDFSGASSGADAGRIDYGSWMNVATIALVAWVNPDGVSAYQSLIDRDVNTVSRDWQFRISNTGKVEFVFWTTGGGPFGVTGSTTLVAGNAYMLGASFDGSTAKVFVNGSPDGSLSQSGSLHTSTNNITLGMSHSGSGGLTAQYFDGRGQEFTMFSSLTDANFMQLYTTGIS